MQHIGSSLSDLDRIGPTPDSPHGYRRYHIETGPAPDVAPYPSRFRVRVGRIGLAHHLLQEIVHTRFTVKLVASRPCMYGVFSGPIGGFAPRPKLCVGCLRCMTEHPDFVKISHNPDRKLLGDSYFTPQHVDAVMYESQTGKIPVKGAGYRGKFGGEGWDGMWTDMSEIVRPTRDGIHGREFISTVVHVGERPSYLTFDEGGNPVGLKPRGYSIPLPILFDAPPASVTRESLVNALAEAARQLDTMFVLPLSEMKRFGVGGEHIVPLVSPDDRESLRTFAGEPRMIELGSWDGDLFNDIRRHFPAAIPSLRVNFDAGFEQQLLDRYDTGVRVFHLVADYHGRGAGGDFVLDLIRRAHRTLVDAGRRDQATLIGGGGIVAAEHVPKAILCGLDCVSLETPLLVALQLSMEGDCVDRSTSRFTLHNFPAGWGVQRLKNLAGSWRDQLLEVLGAMGLREVRRMRGELGRAMFQVDLEREAFEGIEGYERA